MLKHSDLIKKLTIQQKIILLTNLRNNNLQQVEGFPSIKVVDLDKINYKKEWKLPTLNQVAFSWDNSLIEEYYSILSGLARVHKDNVVVINGGSTLNQSISANKISEDGVLTGNILNAVVNGIQYQGVVPIIGEFYVNNEDLPYIDNKYNDRVFHDTFLKQYQILCKNNNDFLIAANNKCQDKVYSKANVTQLNKILREDFHYNKLLVTNEYTKNMPLKNRIALNNAVGYDGTVVEEDLDNLIDELLEIILKNNDSAKEKLVESKIEDTIYRAYLNSIVLLKNVNLLPVKFMFDVGVLVNSDKQDLDIDSVAHQYHNCNNAILVNKAKNLDLVKAFAEKDLIIMFINIQDGKITDEDSEYIKKLRSQAKNIIGIVTTSNCFDSSFDEDLDALIMAPDDSNQAIKAIFEVIYGKFSPCGKTTMSYPTNLDEMVKTIKDLNSKEQYIGECTGYRYYDKISEKVKYPFGFGLTYSDFEFDNFNCSNEEISFTVKNNGIYAASEIVQIYLGIENTQIPRAEKSLYTYLKVTLRPNEIHKYKVKFTKDAFTKFDANNDTYNVEKGIYSIYVNTSINQTKLRGRILVDGTQFLPIKDEKEFKIEKQQYKEDKTNKVKEKKPKKNHTRVLLKGANILGILIALVLTVLSFLKWDILCGSLAIVAFIIGLIGLVMINKIPKPVEQEEITDDIVANIDLDELFKESEIKENFQEEVNTNVIEQETTKETKIEYFENNKIEGIYKEIRSLVNSEGLQISDDKLKLFIACISSSRLILVKNNDQELFNKFMKVINLYFGNESCNPCVVSEEVAKFGVFKDNPSETNTFYKDLLYASKNENDMCFIPVSNLNRQNVKYYKEIFNDLSSDVHNVSINIDNKSIILPKNAWYVFSFDSIEDIYTLPKQILQKASFVYMELSEGAATEVKPDFKHINLFSYDYLVKNIRKEKCISEDSYKKFDLLSEYVNKFVRFKFENKQNISLENIAAILLALGKNEDQTIDALIISKILPLTYSLLKGRVENVDELYAEFGSLFGEENLENALRILDSMKKVD